MKRLLLIFFVSSIFLFSCRKPASMPNNGIYHGLFYKIHDTGDTLIGGVVDFALSEAQQSFALQGDSISNAPFSHGGHYTIENSTHITYSSNPAPGTDPLLYLDTTYQYKFDDINFEFWTTVGQIKLEYKLERD
jgi:hypothetical protein